MKLRVPFKLQLILLSLLNIEYGYGVGQLQAGGSYVSLISPDSKDLTIVIETLSHDHSVCIRPRLPRYNVTNQTATFQLKGNFVRHWSLSYHKLWQCLHAFMFTELYQNSAPVEDTS
jgi:galactosylceramidase